MYTAEDRTLAIRGAFISASAVSHHGLKPDVPAKNNNTPMRLGKRQRVLSKRLNVLEPLQR